MWEFKYQPGRDLIVDVGTKALPAARMREMRKNMSMGWQPCTVDAVDEEDEGIVAPRAVKLVARYHLSNVTKMMVVLSKFQTVHGVTKENNIEKASEAVSYTHLTLPTKLEV